MFLAEQTVTVKHWSQGSSGHAQWPKRGLVGPVPVTAFPLCTRGWACSGCRSGTELWQPWWDGVTVESRIYLKQALDSDSRRAGWGRQPEAVWGDGVWGDGVWGDGMLQRRAGIQLCNGLHCPQNQRHMRRGAGRWQQVTQSLGQWLSLIRACRLPLVVPPWAGAAPSGKAQVRTSQWELAGRRGRGRGRRRAALASVPAEA